MQLKLPALYAQSKAFFAALHDRPAWMDNMLAPLPTDPRDLVIQRRDLAP